MNENQQQRVSNARKVLGNPHNIVGHAAGHEEATEQLSVLEGVHYDVLASTLVMDYHMPTVVHWKLGGEEYVDNFSDITQSKKYRKQARIKYDEEQ